MIASLPMYDPPALHWANDALWQAIRAALPFDAPATLTRGADPWRQWESPDLLLSQTCGLPFRARLHRDVHLVATPDYGLPDCPPGYYTSTPVTRPGAPIAGRLAYNDALSQSGWAAAEGLGLEARLETGAHAASMEAVLRGQADVAFVDSHSLRLLGLPEGLQRHKATPPTPGLPLITARASWVDPLRRALREALDRVDARARTALGLVGFVHISAADYRTIPIPPAP